MSIQAMTANQHLAATLHTIADLIDTHAATLPEPVFARVVIDIHDPAAVADWARTQLGCGTATDNNGRVFVERWFDSIAALRIQAEGGGTL